MFNKYPQELNLQSYDVFHECDPYKPMFFDVQGIMGKTLGYGKHAFGISITNPEYISDGKLSNLKFKDNSNIIFEVIDNFGSIVYSGLTTISHIYGLSYGFIYIQEDALGTSNEVANGPAKLVVVGELDGPDLPDKWKNTYNIRTQIPFIIRKNTSNTSDN